MNAASAIELLKHIISIPSLSRQEEGVADLMQKTLNEYGYECHRKGNNVWAYSKNYSAEKPTILLDAHLDTVRPSDKWSMNP
ncbi:MAG: acetylornithine deacetylase, partial [Tidjanibacter sp.]|nr:acetylornithine deacetylase [Tidjanibacter sp.]